MTDVAIFLPSLRGGGAERAMVNLANGMAVRGLSVSLVLVRAEGPYLSELSPEVEVVDLRARRVLSSLPGLVRYLRRVRPRALLSVMSHANVVAVAARSVARIPVRIVVSERANFSVPRRDAISLRERGLVPLMRWAYRRADCIAAVSEGVAEDLSGVVGVPPQQIRVIYNPVVSQTLFEHARDVAAHPWLLDGAVPVILGVGRLVSQKDFPTLVRAFARLRAEARCRLILLGEGEGRAELEAMVRELNLAADVALPGFVDNPFSWMARAAVFVLSSRFEGLPNALIQAMALGVPVVSTDCPSGPAEILENGRWGRLVPVGDSAALANAILATLREGDHPDVRLRAGAFAVGRAVDGYMSALGLLR